MKNTFKWILYSLILLFLILHNDMWFWKSPQIVLGLPIGLLFHILFCLGTSLLMYFIVKYAWSEK